MILIPAIDIRGGRAVRLEQGDFERETEYAADPFEAARTWVGQGARALHVVDLDGARAGEPRSLDHLRRIAGELGVPVQYGGGLRSVDHVRAALEAGAAKVILGTAAHRDPRMLDALVEEWPERTVVAVDVRGGALSVSGWTESAGVAVERALADLEARGVEEVIYTSIDRDGMLEGPDLDEVRRVASAFEGRLVYSAGVGSVDHLVGLRDLDLGNLTGVVSGKALYERRFTVEEGNAALDGAG